MGFHVHSTNHFIVEYIIHSTSFTRESLTDIIENFSSLANVGMLKLKVEKIKNGKHACICEHLETLVGEFVK